MRSSLRKLEGIQSVEVDLDLEEAIVRYVPELVTIEAMTKATTAIGFPSSEKMPQS
ncbi:MAG: heavy-metal-associated domain-containing protein [Pseudomonadales bacterium]|nr:heavy-metal-associated domain-containing protein [Pseudomonadales bacterium]